MCGIAGIIDPSLDGKDLRRRVAAMQAKIRHRGPDAEGLYFDDKHGVGLAHTRLSIIDLSPSGNQPMQADGDRYTITFNGEIYNFLELRSELESLGAQFRSRSDTEVILEAYRAWGDDCAKKFIGMFAFAIWDRLDARCFLARGPMGIKPLYIWPYGRGLAFASEVRALLSAEMAPRRVSPRGLRGYLMYGAVQEPLTLIEGIETLPPGHALIWQHGKTTIRPFARIEFPKQRMAQDQSVETTREALEASVRRHFVSDVPVSIFLSGGIDSTAILAVARRCGFDNLRTFCISFDEADFNEGELAVRTANHFGADHHDWRMTAADGRKLIADFLNALDQPSIDGFNTFCVSKFAHIHGAKVVLSGLGGDELFGGYQSFQTVPRLMEWHRRVEPFKRLRSLVGAAGQRFARQSRWQRAAAYLQSTGGAAAAYWTMRGIFTPAEADRIVAHGLGAARVGFGGAVFGATRDDLSTDEDLVSYLELTHYMQNQLLRDSDVMSMAWGLELRVPFVDKSLLEQISRIPAAIRLAAGKRLVLDAVPEIPSWIAGGPKRGFAFPFQTWLDGEWSGVFERISRDSPVRLGAWYRSWALFTLQHFLQKNQISADFAICN